MLLTAHTVKKKLTVVWPVFSIFTIFAILAVRERYDLTLCMEIQLDPINPRTVVNIEIKLCEHIQHYESFVED